MSFLVRKKTLEQARAESEKSTDLKRTLGRLDLYMIGVGSTIGAGIFVLTGVVAREYAGPAICISFLLSGLAIFFSAMCYAELAARVPISGSAYSYAVVTIGEFPAFLIGWNLTLEYSITAAAVSRGFADYFVAFFAALGSDVPSWMYNIEVLGSAASETPASTVATTTSALTTMTTTLSMQSSTASVQAMAARIALPAMSRADALIDFNLLALVTGLGIGAFAAYGGKSSSWVNVLVNIITIGIILFCIVYGAVFTDAANWSNFAPFGVNGIAKGAAVVFFAFIGFDAISCSAEEATHPQSDLPFSMITSLLTCTLLYVGVAVVLTLMVPFSEINIDAPLSYAFVVQHVPWAQVLVSLGSLTALFTTVLTSYVAQSRIFFAMARDGLLPQFVARVVGPRRVPLVAVLLVVVFGSLGGAFVRLESLAEMVSIGTLVALTFVCASVLILRYQTSKNKVAFPLTLAIVLLFCIASALFRFSYFIASTALFGLGFLAGVPFLSMDQTYTSSLTFSTPFLPFFPICGLALNCFFMASLGDTTWIRLGIWSAAGVLIYFLYSCRNSRVGKDVADTRMTTFERKSPSVNADADADVADKQVESANDDAPTHVVELDDGDHDDGLVIKK